MVGHLQSQSVVRYGLTLGKPNFLERRAYPDEKRWQFADTVTYSMGNHTLKFGGDVNRVNDLLDNLFQEGGAYTYNNVVDFISDFAIPSGRRYTRYNQGFGPSAFSFTTTDYNFFIQDDIRVTPQADSQSWDCVTNTKSCLNRRFPIRQRRKPPGSPRIRTTLVRGLDLPMTFLVMAELRFAVATESTMDES